MCQTELLTFTKEMRTRYSSSSVQRNERLIWLVYEFPKYLEALHDACKRHKKKFLFRAENYEALTFTSQSTVLCVRYPLDSGYFYVLTRDLSRDLVGLLFSAMRQMTGGNDCLDARAVTFNLEKILRTGILGSSQNCHVAPSQSVSRYRSFYNFSVLFCCDACCS